MALAILVIMETELLPLNRAARRLGVPSRWLRAEANAGRVPCLRAGTRYLFEMSALTETLAERLRLIARNEEKFANRRL
jgi:hypothetical protein